VLGLCRARNTGWKNARGNVVAFLDDDAIASPVWVENILAGFRDFHPRPGVVSGKIEPIWEAARPGWLSDNIVWALCVLNASKRPLISRDRPRMAGTNMAFERAILEDVGGFDVSLDRRGRKLISNGDILVGHRIIRKGHSCLYHPDICVKHHIPPGRLTQSWFIRRMYWEGASTALLEMKLDRCSIAWRVRRGATAMRNLLGYRRRLLHLVVPTEERYRFEQKCLIWHDVGYLLGVLGMAR
jgi:glucosyl-dolichyl phosphate glucuronosyltransferase